MKKDICKATHFPHFCGICFSRESCCTFSFFRWVIILMELRRRRGETVFSFPIGTQFCQQRLSLELCPGATYRQSPRMISAGSLKWLQASKFNHFSYIPGKWEEVVASPSMILKILLLVCPPKLLPKQLGFVLYCCVISCN